MNKIVTVLILLLIGTQAFSQKKQLWAKSYIDKKAPELVIEEWVSEVPNTEGKFILIDFWATWCAPCRKGIPKMNEYHTKFANDMVIIGLSKESKDKVSTFKSPKIEYYNAIDINGRMNTIYGVKGIPHVVLIDPKGIVRWEGFPTLPGFELTSKIIEDIIEKYK